MKEKRLPRKKHRDMLTNSSLRIRTTNMQRKKDKSLFTYNNYISLHKYKHDKYINVYSTCRTTNLGGRAQTHVKAISWRPKVDKTCLSGDK